MVDEELEAILNNVKSAKLQEAAAVKERLLLARAKAPELAAILRDDFGASSVWLVGSAAHGQHFRLQSDIDLAVEGLLNELTIPATVKLEKEAEPFPHVDLIRIEDCDDHARGRVLREALQLV